MLPVLRHRYQNENGDGGAGGSMGSASGNGNSDGNAGSENSGGLTGYDGGFNAAKDSQAANESLGLGADSSFSGNVDLGFSAPTRSTAFQSFLNNIKSTAQTAGLVGMVSANPVLSLGAAVVGASAGLASSLANSGLSFGASDHTGTNQIGGGFGDNGGFTGGGADGEYKAPLINFPAQQNPSLTNPLKVPMVAFPPGKGIEIISPVVSPPAAEPLATRPQGQTSLQDSSSGGVSKTTDWIALATLVVSGVALFSGK